MRLKLIVLLVVALGYLAILFGCGTAPAGLIQNSNAKANTNAAANTNVAANSNAAANMNASDNANTGAATSSNTSASKGDGINPPHAIDKTGKVIPPEGIWQPNESLVILSKDSKRPKPDSGELKPEAAFDHLKHSTVASYGLDGKTTALCVDCHHTDQPSAPKGQEYLKKFESTATLTTAQLEASKENVKSCRACHFQATFRRAPSPASLTYPPEMNRLPTGKLTNEVAYHLNCNTCHDVTKKRNPATKAPQGCKDCHMP